MESRELERMSTFQEFWDKYAEGWTEFLADHANMRERCKAITSMAPRPPIK